MNRNDAVIATLLVIAAALLFLAVAQAYGQT